MSTQLCMLDVLPSDVIDLIIEEAVIGHISMVKLMRVCKTFRAILDKQSMWKRVVAIAFGNRDDIIQFPVSEVMLWSVCVALLCRVVDGSDASDAGTTNVDTCLCCRLSTTSCLMTS